jgi:hypothetical protein
VDCPTFDRWLNEGRPATTRDDARRHADECVRCAEELSVARALDDALAQRFATTSSAFTDLVMDRIAAEAPSAAPEIRLPEEPELPWWIRLLQDPATVLACLVAATVLAAMPELLAAPGEWALSVAHLPGAAVRWFGAPELSWLTLPGLALPLLGALSVALYRGSLRWADRRPL